MVYVTRLSASQALFTGHTERKATRTTYVPCHSCQSVIQDQQNLTLFQQWFLGPRKLVCHRLCTKGLQPLLPVQSLPVSKTWSHPDIRTPETKTSQQSLFFPPTTTVRESRQVTPEESSGKSTIDLKGRDISSEIFIQLCEIGTMLFSVFADSDKPCTCLQKQPGTKGCWCGKTRPQSQQERNWPAFSA